MRHSGLRSPFAALILFASLVVTFCGDSGTCSGPFCHGGGSVASTEERIRREQTAAGSPSTWPVMVKRDIIMR